MTKRIVVVLSVLLAVALTFTGCTREETSEPGLKVVRIGYQPTAFYAYLFLAEERGMFEEAGLKAELVRIPSANEMFQAFLAGQLDMTGLTATEILLRGFERSPDSFYLPLLVELGPDAVMDRILVRNDSPIQSLSDLEGLTVGSHPGTTVPNILRALLARSGVDPESVEIQELRPELQVESLLSGAVSAIICLEPCGTELLVTGEARVLVDHPFGAVAEHFPASFTTLSREFVEGDPEATDRLLGVIREAVQTYQDLASSDRETIDRILVEYLGTRPEVAARLNPVLYRLPEEWSAEDIEKVVRFYQDLEIISEPVDLEASAIPSVQEERLREAA